MAQPAVVTVISKSNKGTAFASGFFVDTHLVMTNRHLVEGGAQVTIMNSAGQRVRVEKVVSTSATYDLAVVRVAKPGRARLVVSDRGVHKGQPVVLVGAPLRGLASYTAGTIVDIAPGGDSMTLSATVSQRNSGAPVLDDQGYVVGVAMRTTNAGAVGNHAVPVDHLQDLLMEAKVSSSGDGGSASTPDDVATGGGAPDDNGATKTVTITPEAAQLPKVNDGQFVEVLRRGQASEEDNAKKAKAACAYNDQHGEYLCDPVVLAQFHSHLSVQQQDALKTKTETFDAKLIVDDKGCAKAVNVTYGDSALPTQVNWAGAVFVVGGAAAPAQADTPLPPANFQTPAGARTSVQLSSATQPCLLPDVVSDDVVLSLQIPVQAGTYSRLARFQWKQAQVTTPLTAWHAMRYQTPPPEAGPPGEQPMPPKAEDPPYALYGGAAGVVIPLAAGGLVGIGVAAATAGSTEMPLYLVGVAGASVVGAVAGGGIGALMGVFASRQAQEERAALWRDYNAANTAWEQRNAAHKKWSAYKRATKSLHDGAR